MANKPVIVIVPGSCHRAEHYQRLVDKLTKYNYEAIALTPPSLDSNPPHASWDKDAEAIRRVVTENIDAGRDVVAVAHSFGGVAMSEAVKGLGKRARENDGLKGGVVGLVYMTALALVEGQSQATLIVPQTPEENELFLAYQEGMKKYSKGMMPVNEAGMIVPDRETTRQVVYHGCDPNDVEEALDLLGAQPIAPMAAPVTYTAYREIPSTFILCENDRAVPPYIQEKMVAQAGNAMEIVRCQEGHVPYLSNPGLVVDCIRRAAGESV
ncbi:conserved hypothetical protein [Histoplasma capsulatum G186AR]|uniref:AB hydrolase-1 domain-containing protein n=2 Tax=Ajellomyces capsulatus TaxID=5037 RepID=C0NHP1_AJECG|nr:uncharacterized protein HCBG_02863 [Histoplasma capsulatum G186AR]EEH09326.1 conserved hypothetical protein [Histoplasma capsulatum G186AR]KAG5303335.1 esterase/lipase superfamily domain-containing protein [Histoplasma capsulatum]QSS68933.1 esterase/lipase superfamily domain-containing protein [Histoplasma capsulatum G186AR]